MQALDPLQLTGLPQEVQLPSIARGGGSLLIENESQYALKASNAGFQKWIGPWWADLIPITNGGLPVTFVPTLLNSPVPAAPSSHALLTFALPGEAIPGAYPVSIGRQQSSYSQPQKLFTAPADGATYTATVRIPAGAHSIVLMLTAAPGNVTSLLVQGDVTGANGTRYYDSALNAPGTAFGSSLFWAAVLSPHDTALTFTFRGTGAGGIYAHAAMDPEAVALVAGTQVKALLFGGDLGQINTWASSSAWSGTAPYTNGMVVTSYGSAPAPWQSPNQMPVGLTFQLAANASRIIVPAVVGQRIYLHPLDFFFTASTAGCFGKFTDTTGANDFGDWNASTAGPFSFKYSGDPLPVGQGFVMVNQSAVAMTGFVNGKLSLSQT